MNPTKIPSLEEMTDILDIREFTLWDLSFLTYLALGLILLTLLVLGLFLYRRFFRKKTQAPPLTPLQKALIKLDSLKIPSLSKVEAVRLFYFALSECFRDFLEEEKGLEASEATSEELKPLLKRAKIFTEAHRRDCFEFLETADLAKFGKWPPEKEETLKKHYQFCRQSMIALTEVDSAPPSEKEPSLSSDGAGKEEAIHVSA